MYFTSGSDRAFERFMMGNPASTITTAAGSERRRTAGLAAITARTGSINSASTQSVPTSRAS